MNMNRIISTDPLQPGYTYEVMVPEGTDFDPEFKPHLTPKELLALGIFGGDYFEGTHQEFPEDWFRDAKLSDIHDKTLNYFGVDASQTRAVWQAKGWIHSEDPRGWFQWYCRYYLGRRLPEEDARQIKRWKQMARHAAQVRYVCRKGDATCHTRQRQALLHWAYDSRGL